MALQYSTLYWSPKQANVSQHFSFGQHLFKSSHHIILITHLFSLCLPFFCMSLSFLIFSHPSIPPSYCPLFFIIPFTHLFSLFLSVLLAIIYSFLPLFPSSPLTTVSFLCWLLCSFNPVGGAVDREEGGAQRERCRGG